MNPKMLNSTWAILSLLAALVAVSGCSSSAKPQHTDPEPQPQQSAAMSAGHPPEATQPEESPSAAAPGTSGRASLNTGQLFEKAIGAVKALDLSAEPASMEVRIHDPNFVFLCAYAPARTADEVPVLACRFGEYVNTVTGHTLFWKEGDEWKGAFYPQASEGIARSRQAYFQTLGENCPKGCAGGFKVLRQEGARVLAVVDLSSVASHGTDEVHLLERDPQKGAWRILWVPTPDEYRFQGWPKVTLPGQGIGQFTVAYQVGGQDTWVFDGTKFVRQ